MAKVRNNIFVRGLSGQVGEQFVVKVDKGGRTIVSNVPTFPETRTFSEAQLEWQGIFRDAAAYAMNAKTNPIYVQKAQGTHLTSYNLAMGDFFNKPEIREIDASGWNGETGQVIRIRAVDDTQVTQVKVTITDDEGQSIEEGMAVFESNGWWNYTTTDNAPGGARVVVAARDLPGNETREEWD